MIKHNSSVILHSRTNADGSHTIRIRVTFLCTSLDFYMPYAILEGGWDKRKCRAKANYVNGHVSAVMINKAINNALSAIDDYFAECDIKQISPSKDVLKGILSGDRSATVEANRMPIRAIFDEFIESNKVKCAWTDATVQKIRNLQRHLVDSNPHIRMSDFDDQGLTHYINHLHSIGLCNSTIQKNYANLKWFLGWCERKGYLSCRDYAIFRPKLKGTSNKPKADLYLEWDELMALKTLDLGTNHRGLSACRDVFLFQCFTGLRYSDIAHLTHANLFFKSINGVQTKIPDVIRFTTIKTADPLTVELNDYAVDIINKYIDIPIHGDLLLPVTSNVHYNKNIKAICQMAGIDKPTECVHYYRQERVVKVQPKYELLSSHTARHTFIVHALRLGIPPEVVMKWTGHSGYAAMKPYIAVVDASKREEMDKFNDLYDDK